MKSTAALLKVDSGMRSQRHVWAARLGIKVLPNTDHGCTFTFDPELSRGDNIHLMHFLRASCGKDLSQINTLSIKTSDTSASLVKQFFKDGTVYCWQFASPSGSIQQADVVWLLLCLQALHPLQPQTVWPLPLPDFGRLVPRGRLARPSEPEARLVHGLWRIIAGVSTEKTAYCGLNDRWVNDDTICAIAKRLGVNNVLRHLSLADSVIGPAGAMAIGDALRVNSALTSLNLGKNDIGAEGAQAIGDALCVNGVLTSLDLYANLIGDQGAKAIAEAIKVNGVLTSLNLWGCGIGREGAKAFADALLVNRVLTDLNLSYNEYKQMGAALRCALREIAKDRPSLTLKL